MRLPRLIAGLFVIAIAFGAPALAQAAQPAACPASHVTRMALPHVQATLARNHELLVVALGSSSTVSWMASNIGHSYPAILQDELNDRLPDAHIAVINRGIGGQAAAQELARMDADVLAIRPQLVIWQVGANDVLRDVDPTAFRRQLIDGVTRLKQAGIDVVLMDNQRSPRLLAIGEHDVIDAELAAVAKQTGAMLFARSTLMDQWQSEGFPYATFVAADRLHHNDRGYRCVADALAEAIGSSLSRQGTGPAPGVVSKINSGL